MAKHLFFDLDGTLSDPFYGITHSVQYALRKQGIEVDDLWQLARFIGPPLQDSFRDFYGFDESQIRQAIDDYHENFIAKGIFENVLYPGIPELLANLNAAGKKLYVATSKPEPLAVDILKHFHIYEHFCFVGGDTMQNTRSAKARVIEYVLKENKLTDLGEVVMIGDRRHDIEGGKAAGLSTTVGVLWGYGSKDELQGCGADYMVEKLEQLEVLLKNIV